MKINKKILFTDLDGTLLNSKKQISNKTYEYLRDFCMAGHYLVLSSGRDINSVGDVKDEIGLDFPGVFLVGYNGGQIFDCGNAKTLYKIPMPKKNALKILKIASELNIYGQTYSETHIIAPYECKELTYYKRVIKTPVIFTDDFVAELSEDPYKCLAVDLDKRENLELLQEKLHSLVPEVTAAFSGPYYLDILPAASGKGNALKKLCGILNIPITDAIAAGDEENDSSMLEAAGTSIVMINGLDRLKQSADIITEYDNNHDGLIHALMNIIDLSLND